VGGHGGLRGQGAVACQLLAYGFQRGLGSAHGVASMANVFRRHRAGFGHGGAAAQVVAGAGQVGLALGDGGGVHVVVHVQGADLAHRLRELSARIVERDFGIGRVQRDDRFAGLDDLRVVGVDGHHGARHLRRELHEVAVDVGVVGVFVVLRNADVVRAIAGGGHDGGQAQRDQQGLAASLQGGGGSGGGFGNRLRFVLERGVHLGTCSVERYEWEAAVQRACVCCAACACNVFCGVSW
jgi:hypothetical protein